MSAEAAPADEGHAGEEAPQASRPRRTGRRHQKATLADRVLMVLLIAASGWFGWQCVKLIRADFQAMHARTMVFAWAAGTAKWTVANWVYARDALLAASRTTPGNPAIYDQLGMLYAVRGRDAFGSPPVQRIYYLDALRHQEASVALRPRHGWSWAALAATLNHLEPASERVWDAWRKAYAFTPYEPSVQRTLLEIGLRQWGEAPPDVKNAMRATYSGAMPSLRKEADAMAQRLRVADWTQAPP